MLVAQNSLGSVCPVPLTVRGMAPPRPKGAAPLGGKWPLDVLLVPGYERPPTCEFPCGKHVALMAWGAPSVVERFDFRAGDCQLQLDDSARPTRTRALHPTAYIGPESTTTRRRSCATGASGSWPCGGSVRERRRRRTACRGPNFIPLRTSCLVIPRVDAAHSSSGPPPRSDARCSAGITSNMRNNTTSHKLRRTARAGRAASGN